MTISWSFAVDGLSTVMLALVVGVGAAVAAHARRYLPAATRGRVLALLAVFAIAMAMLVTADDLLLLYLAWEATSVLSFLLIGTKDTDPAAREAARRALYTTGAGGLALLVGLILLIQETGETTLSGLATTTPSGGAATAAAVLVLLGALTKSAQMPFHRWLPGAMAAPAPVSAYLHSATMVKAGVYLVLRLSPTFAEVPAWELMLLVSAGGGVLIGGWRALRATDLKALFAWSTVSQLGLLVLVGSAPIGKAVLAGTAMLIAHALAKAALFLAVGTIESGTGTRMLSDLGGLGRDNPLLGVTVSVALASLAGIPPLYGFVAKEGALVGLLDGGEAIRLVLLVGGSVLTAGYATRVIRTLWAPGTAGWKGVAPAMLAAPAALAGTAALLGVAWPLGHRIAALGATAVVPDADAKQLVLWGGLNAALGLSVLAVTLGVLAAVFVRAGSGADGPVVDVQARLLDLPGDLGRIVVALVRPGVLAPTVGVLMAAAATAALLPVGAGLLDGTSSPLGDLPPVGGWLRGSAALVIVVGAVASSRIRHRFGAVLALGVVGFAMTGYFVVINAPDLALTQALVETVIVLAFLLVLRRLPPQEGREQARERPHVGTWLRAAVATGLGLGVALLALVVAAPSRISPVGQEIVDRAYPDGAGRNVVNVILTDVRALDTLGEIAVVAVAALGALRLFGGSITGLAASRAKLLGDPAQPDRGPQSRAADNGDGDRSTGLEGPAAEPETVGGGRRGQLT